MIETAKAIFTGFVVGVIFSALRLPIPAPQVIQGIAGIFGIYLGFELVANLPKIIDFIQGIIIKLWN